MNPTKTLVALGVAAVGVVTLSGTASAARPAVDFATGKAKCEAAIDARLTQIDQLATRAGSAKTLTAAHSSTISTFLADAKTGLTDLRAKVEADTDAATLKADCEDVATEYRIYALRTPQVHFAVAGDRQAQIVKKGNAVADSLEAAVNKAEQLGKDVTDARAALADMRAKLSDASAQLQGLVDTELTYSPADWNANHAVLTPTRTALSTAQGDLKGAFKDAATVVAELKG